MTTKIANCTNCEASFDEEAEGYFSSAINGLVCDACYQNDLEAPSTIIVIRDGEVSKYYVGDIVRINEYGDDTDMEITRKYTASDSWRGYFETTINGWETILEGWTTGGWDDGTSARKELFNDWCSQVVEYPPSTLNYPFAIIIDATSNVFSTAITVQVPSNHVSDFREWLGEELSELSKSLS
jgi:hypothetical protein